MSDRASRQMMKSRRVERTTLSRRSVGRTSQNAQSAHLLRMHHPGHRESGRLRTCHLMQDVNNCCVRRRESSRTSLIDLDTYTKNF